MSINPSKPRGFTLVEMAVVLVIFGLLLGALLLPLSAQLDQRDYADNKKRMDEIKEALIGYGASRGYMPCPAVSFENGSENRVGNGCALRAGYLPWAELGVPKLDPWGHIYQYSVTPAYADSATKISMTTNEDITIRTRDSVGTLINLSNSNSVPAVVISFGKNGAWGVNNEGAAVGDVSATNIDEDSNGNNAAGQVFVSRDFSSNTGLSGGEFDDVVVWLSANVYINRMISAGQLP